MRETQGETQSCFSSSWLSLRCSPWVGIAGKREANCCTMYELSCSSLAPATAELVTARLFSSYCGRTILHSLRLSLLFEAAAPRTMSDTQQAPATPAPKSSGGVCSRLDRAVERALFPTSVLSHLPCVIPSLLSLQLLRCSRASSLEALEVSRMLTGWVTDRSSGPVHASCRAASGKRTTLRNHSARAFLHHKLLSCMFFALFLPLSPLQACAWCWQAPPLT